MIYFLNSIPFSLISMICQVHISHKWIGDCPKNMLSASFNSLNFMCLFQNEGWINHSLILGGRDKKNDCRPSWCPKSDAAAVRDKERALERQMRRSAAMLLNFWCIVCLIWNFVLLMCMNLLDLAGVCVICYEPWWNEPRYPCLQFSWSLCWAGCLLGRTLSML